MRAPRTKQEALDRLSALLGVERLVVGKGSTEPKRAFVLAIERLGLPISTALRKPELGQAIAAAAGLPWGPECDSRHTPSGGGGTVTLAGLNRVIEAVEALADERLTEGAPPPALGVPYRVATGGVTAPPRQGIRDWTKLDEASREHAELQNELASWLKDRGLEPRSPTIDEPQYDLAWQSAAGRVICEVKTADEANRRQQFRLGLGQVIEYRHRLATDAPPAAVLYLGAPADETERAVGRSVDVTVLYPSDLSPEAIARAPGAADLFAPR